MTEAERGGGSDIPPMTAAPGGEETEDAMAFLGGLSPSAALLALQM